MGTALSLQMFSFSDKGKNKIKVVTSKQSLFASCEVVMF